MAENSVEERMLELIEEICDDDVIREERDVDLFEEGLLDSMAAIELLVAIETEFGVTIAPTAVEREEMNTVNKIIYQVQIRYYQVPFRYTQSACTPPYIEYDYIHN